MTLCIVLKLNNKNWSYNMKKIINLVLMLFVVKFIIQASTGIYIPGVVVWCIGGYLFINDAGLMKLAKKQTDDFKEGIKTK